MKTVSVKIGKMRKTDECVVYPELRNGLIFIQGDRLVAMIDPESGKTILNHNTGSTYPTSCHLVKHHKNTYSVTIDKKLIAEILEAQPSSGDAIGGGVYVANYQIIEKILSYIWDQSNY